MQPIGLTMKHGRNKYRRDQQGELMLIHECIECQALSINRIAADDDSANILAIFEESLELDQQTHLALQQYGIMILSTEAISLVHRQLYGRAAEILVSNWV